MWLTGWQFLVSPVFLFLHRDELMEDYQRSCADADVLVAGVLTEDYVSTIAEAKRLPLLSVHFNPMRPNEVYPNALVTVRLLPGFLSRGRVVTSGGSTRCITEARARSSPR